MAIRNIVKEGDPILNKVCRPVTNFDDRLITSTSSLISSTPRSLLFLRRKRRPTRAACPSRGTTAL